MGGQCWHGCMDTDLKWGRRAGKAEPQHFCVCALLGNACVLVGKSAENKGCPKWGAKLWGSLSPSLFQAPQESHYLQFSSTECQRKGCNHLFGRGRAGLDVGGTCQGVTSSLAHFVRGWQPACHYHCRANYLCTAGTCPTCHPPFLSHLPFCCGSLKWFCTHKTRTHVQLLSSVH